MPVAALGLLDLSAVTDGLLKTLDDCVAASPLFAKNGGPVAAFDIGTTGNPPDAVRTLPGTHLSLFLLHVAEDRFQKNALNTGTAARVPRTQPIPRQPLGLDLYYLLTALSSEGYIKEQQAMSIALRCFHEQPVITRHAEQLTLQMEVQSIDEASRLWQATTAPIRLSSLYRVSVVFLSPEVPSPPGPPVQAVRLAAGPAAMPFAAAGGQLTGTQTTATYRPPDSTAAKPLSRSYDLSPAAVRAGDRFLLLGGGLAGTSVFLEGPAGGEVDVTGWLDPNPAVHTDVRLVLHVPQPPATPAPGWYVMRVGQGAVRSNAAALAVAARVDGVANPPLLTPAGGVYTVRGVGFLGTVEVLLGAVPLPAAQVDVGGTRIDFNAPAGLAPGRYPLRLRVGGVESPPSWWVVVL